MQPQEAHPDHLTGTAQPSPVLDRIDEASVIALAETFRMLGDTTRVRILDALSRAELCVQAIARHIDSSESAVSHQLRLLRGMRLVRPRRAGRQVFYSLDDQHIVRLFAQGLEHVQEAGRERWLRETPPHAPGAPPPSGEAA